MFTAIVGSPIDPVAAGFALVAFAGMITIVLTSFIIKRRSMRELSNEFELAKIKLKNEDSSNERNAKNQREAHLADLTNRREIEFKRIEVEGVIDVSPNRAK